MGQILKGLLYGWMDMAADIGRDTVCSTKKLTAVVDTMHDNSLGFEYFSKYLSTFTLDVTKRS